jgi:hypothetical protein
MIKFSSGCVGQSPFNSLREKGSFETRPHEEQRSVDCASPLSRLDRASPISTEKHRLCISVVASRPRVSVVARHPFDFRLGPYAANLRRTLKVCVSYF